MTPIYFRVHKFNVSFQTSSPFDEHLTVVYDVNEFPCIPFVQVLYHQFIISYESSGIYKKKLIGRVRNCYIMTFVECCMNVRNRSR